MLNINLIKRKKYVKSDLVLFVKYEKFPIDSNEHLPTPDKNTTYCFWGIFNNDKTKVKNIFTDEVYLLGPFKTIKANNQIFKYINDYEIQTMYNIKNSTYSLKTSTSQYSYITLLNNLAINSEYESSALFDFFYASGNQIFDITYLKKFTKEFNNKINKILLEKTKQQENSLKLKNTQSKTILTQKEKDF